MTAPLTPEPSLEWIITDQCNYACTYCFQRKYAAGQHCSDDTIDAVSKLLGTLPGSWHVKLIGGEPFLHPRFSDICAGIIKAGHRITTTTNLSLPIRVLERVIDTCGDRLDRVTASLHIDEVGSVDDFIERVVAFDARRNRATAFSVVTVLVQEHFEQLKEIERRLSEKGITLSYQPLRVGGKYIRYSDEFEEFLREKSVRKTEAIRHKKLFGTLCHTGELFFKIEVNGDVVRCYNVQPSYFLGNVTKGTFKRFDGPRPCLARRCTCMLPAGRNMIRFGQRASKPALIRAGLQGWTGSLTYVSAKVLALVRGQLAQRRRRRPDHPVTK